MSIEYIKYFSEIIYKYISRPKLVLYFESSESYHTRIVPNQNNTQGFFCHLMVKNTGRKTAKSCRARVIDIQAEDTTGSFALCPGFLSPFILKWAHEDNFNPKDIEPDIPPARLDLCCGLQNRPNNLIFTTQQKADGNQTIYPPGTYKVKVRVNAENTQTVDREFVIQFGGSWNDIRVTTYGGDKKKKGTVRTRKTRRLTRWIKVVFVFAAITTLLYNIKEIMTWFFPTKIQTLKSKGRQLPLTNEKKLSVSLKEICKDIDSRPLAQRSDTAKQYVGIRIQEERLKLLDVDKNPKGDIYLLSMVFPDQSDTSYSTGRRILCDIPKEQYPELNLAKQGVELYISGQIKEAGAKYIELSDVSLKFD